MRITTGKVGTPPKPRTRESPFRAAPAASPANRKIEATRAHTRHYVGVQGEVTSCDGSTGMGRTAARSAWRKAQGSGAGATHLHGVDDDREEEEAPAGPSARPGLEPEAHHQLPASRSRSPVWLAAHAAQMPQLTIEADSVAKHEALHACGENEGGGSDGSRKSCCCGSSAECCSPWRLAAQLPTSQV